MSSVTDTDTDTQRSIFLVPHPKIVFLYPTFVAAVVAGFYALFTKDPDGQVAHMISLTFLVIFGLNLVVIAFDFPRTASLTIFFAVLALAIGLVLLFTFYPHWWPRFHEWIRSLNPDAN